MFLRFFKKEKEGYLWQVVLKEAVLTLCSLPCAHIITVHQRQANRNKGAKAPNEIENNREEMSCKSPLTFSYLSDSPRKLKSTALQVSAENPQHIRHHAKLWTFPGVF